MNNVLEARLRLATPQEVTDHRGGLLWRTLTTPTDLAMGVYAICKMRFQLYLHGPNFLNMTTPLPLAAAHKISYYLGWAPERAFVNDIPLIFSRRHIFFGEPKIIEAILREHRNGELFQNSASMEEFYKIFAKAFPISPNDSVEDDRNKLIFTCSPEYSKLYRNLFHNVLNAKNLQNHVVAIRQEVQELLKQWAIRGESGETVNVTVETRFLASKIIRRLLLGSNEANEALCSAIDSLNYYIAKKVFSPGFSAVDEENLRLALASCNGEVTRVLEAGHSIPLFEGESLSQRQKEALVFAVFFAGQETVASMLTYTLWKLALDSTQQDKLFTLSKTASTEVLHTKIRGIFVKAIREFPPAYGLARILKKDACLEYRLQGEVSPRKFIMHAGTSPVVHILYTADQYKDETTSYSNWLPFGFGPHRCPGEGLAIKEIIEFLRILTSDYEIETEQKHAIAKIGVFTMHLAEEIFITVKRRSLNPDKDPNRTE